MSATFPAPSVRASLPASRARRLSTFILSLAATLWVASLLFAGDSLPSGRTPAIFQTGEEAQITLQLPEAKNPGERELTWKVRDWNQIERQSGHTKLPESPSRSETIAFGSLPSGWYEVEFALDGQSLGKRTFVAGNYYKSKGEQFRYGACTHLCLLKEKTDLETQFHLLLQLGVDIDRDDLIWKFVQKGPGEPFNFEQFDHIAKNLTENGIEWQPVLLVPSSWAANAPAGVKAPWQYFPRVEPFIEFVKASADHFGKTVKYWEIWNEPDIFGRPVEEYLPLYNQAAAEIAKINPDAHVMNGGFAGVPRAPHPDFMRRFIAEVDRTHWKEFVYHDYMTFAETPVRFQEMKQLMKNGNLSLPLWINEGGFYDLLPGGQRMQAITLVKKITTAAALGVKSYFWYDLRDDGTSPTDVQHHFGIVHYDYQPKPAFAAYRQLIYQLADRPILPSKVGAEDGLHVISYGERKESAARSVHVVWRETPGADEPMWLAGDSRQATLRLTDLMGAQAGSEISHGGGLARIGNNPLYVEASEGAKLEVRRILKLPERILALPQDSPAVSIGITNPLPERSKISALLECRVEGKPVPIASAYSEDFAPGETKAVKFQLADETVAGLLKAGVDRAEFSFSFGEGAQPQIIPVMLQCPEVIGAAARPWRVTLEDRAHIVNLFEGVTEEEWHWTGPDDLSAKASAHWQPDGLNLVVDVTDNVHSQKFDSVTLWKGDSLQIAAAPLDRPADCLEVTLGLTNSGQSDAWIFRAPKTASIPAGPLPVSMKAKMERKDQNIRYEVLIPWKALGFDGPADMPFLFNFIINDDDGNGRKQWIQLTAGIGKEKDARLFKTFILRK